MAEHDGSIEQQGQKDRKAISSDWLEEKGCSRNFFFNFDIYFLKEN